MRAQVVVINEIITFTIGVSLVIGLAVFISNLLVPNVREYVFDEGMDNFLKFVDSSLWKFYLSSKESNSVNITYKTDLPDKLLESIYYLTTEYRNLCITLDSYGHRQCIETSLPPSVGISGYYISGTKIKIELFKNQETSLSFTNSY